MSPQAGHILQEEVVPRLRGAIPHVVRCIGAEDPEELIADGTCMAAAMMHRNERRGKNVTPGNIAYYTIQHLKSGRRAHGSSTVDAFGTGTQLNGSSRLSSLHEVVSVSEAGEEIFELHDVVSQDTEDPSVQAARKMDWDSFLSGLSKGERLVVEFLCAGRTLRAAARKARVSDSTIQTCRRKIAQKVAEFMGADILKQIARLPRWKINLDSERQSVLCRHERRAMA